MAKFDKRFVNDVVERVDNIPSDVKPQWGSFTKDALIAHLIGAVEYSMGRQEQLPRAGFGWRPKVIGFIVLSGLFPLPKNVKFRDAQGEIAPPVTATGDITRLREVMEEFVSGLESGTLTVVPHPFFGELTPKNMAKFHVVHIKHHLKQFGA